MFLKRSFWPKPYHLAFGRIPKSFDTPASTFLSSSFEPNITHTHTHIYAPEVVYGIFHSGFLHFICQTVKPAKEIYINLEKLIHKRHLRSLLIVEKRTFNVLITQLIEFQTQIWAKFQNRFVGTLKPMIPGLRDKSHPVINKNAFPRKWVSKVITSDVLHLSPDKFTRKCFGNMKFMKAALWNTYTQQPVETIFRQKKYLKLSQVAFFHPCKKSVKCPCNQLPLLSKQNKIMKG